MSVGTGFCTVCNKREAFYFRPYSGERLCKKCFIKSIEDRVRATVAKYKMLKFDDRIAVAVSGGKDSINLLHILARLEQGFEKASLVAVTVDEGIRGYRDEALQMAKENCRELRIKHYTASFKMLFGHTLDEMIRQLTKKGDRETSCTYCGVLRRKALNILARKAGANKIVTAHTLDDEVQTILLNIFHGDVLRMAREKPVTDEVHPKLVQKVKPFCLVPERESALYAYVRGIKFQAKPCPYASEALRNDVRHMLGNIEDRHAGTMFTIFKSIEKIRPALEEVESRKGLGECSECGEPSAEKICRTCQVMSQLK